MVEDANAVLKSQGKVAKLSVDNFGDLVQAINITQQRLNITGTTAKEASQTISGSVNQMKAAWQNLLTGIADENADFEGLVSNFVESIITMLGNILPRIEVIASGIIDLIVGLAANEDVIKQILGAVVNTFQKIVNTLTERGTDIVKSVMIIVDTVLTTLLKSLPQVVDIGLKIIIALIQGINEELPKLLEMLPEVIMEIGNTLIDNLPMLLDVALQLILVLIQGLNQYIIKMTDYAPTIISKLIDTLMEHMDEIIDVSVQIILALIDGLINALPKLITYLPTIIFTIASKLLEHLPDIIQAGFDLIGGLIDGLTGYGNNQDVEDASDKVVEAIGRVFRELPGKAFKWGADMVDGLTRGIDSKKPGTVVATTGVAGAIRKLLHFSRPDEGPLRDYETWMPDFIEGLANSMEKASPILEKEASNLAGKLRNTMAVQYAIKGIDSNAIEDMRNTMNSEIAKASISGITGTANEILSANSNIVVENNNVLELDGEKVYENQEIVRKNKKLQYAFGG